MDCTIKLELFMKRFRRGVSLKREKRKLFKGSKQIGHAVKIKKYMNIIYCIIKPKTIPYQNI